jgi:hypothetical protein
VVEESLGGQDLIHVIGTERSDLDRQGLSP